MPCVELPTGKDLPRNQSKVERPSKCTSHPKIILYQDIKLPEDWRNCAPKQTKRSTRSYLSLPVNSLPGEQNKKKSAEDRDRSGRVVPPQEELLSIMFLSILEYFIFPYYQK